MPELAVGFLAGFFMTAGLVALHLFLQFRKMKTRRMLLIQKNLRQLGLYWSDSESTIKNDEPGASQNDIKKSIRSILISGVGFMFLSWLGFVMQMTLMLSLRYLAVKRIETRLFESELAEKEVSADVSREIVQKLMQS